MASALAKAGRKLGRVGKDAIKYRYTSAFESIDMICLKGWRPTSLTVRWSRGQRAVSSSPARISEGSESGQFHAVWDPPDEQELLVTLYKETKGEGFDEKEYKFQVEDESGHGKKKVLAVFYINMAEHISREAESEEELSLEFKCNSVKVQSVVVVAKIWCQFLKQGKSYDDDMMSTFSSIDNARDFDDDDDTETTMSVNNVQSRQSLILDSSHNPDQQGTNVASLSEVEQDNKESQRKDGQHSTTLLATASLASTSSVQSSVSSPPPPATQPSTNGTVSPKRDLQSDIADFFLAAHFRDSEGKLISQSDQLNFREYSVLGLLFSSREHKTNNFIETLLKFYKILRDNAGSFEVVFISSDKSATDMMEFVKEQKMPWLSLDYEDDMCDRLHRQYNVEGGLRFVVIDSAGTLLERDGLHVISTAVTNQSEWKTFQQWHAAASLPFALISQSPSYRKEAQKTSHTVEKAHSASASASLSSLATKSSDSISHVDESQSQQEQEGHSGKQTVLGAVKSILKGKKDKKKDRTKSPVDKSSSVSEMSFDEEVESMPVTKHNEQQGKEHKEEKEQKKKEKEHREKESKERMKKKDDRIRQLETENAALKDQVAELRENIEELQQKVEQLANKLNQSEASKAKLNSEKELTEARLVLNGWLLKRGIKGPTARVWRSRWFTLDEQSSRLYYHKDINQTESQGFIDLDMVEGVEEQSPDLQDKNNASFNVIVKGRIYELMAHDEKSMRRWIQALETIWNWRKSQH